MMAEVNKQQRKGRQLAMFALKRRMAINAVEVSGDEMVAFFAAFLICTLHAPLSRSASPDIIFTRGRTLP